MAAIADYTLLGPPRRDRTGSADRRGVLRPDERRGGFGGEGAHEEEALADVRVLGRPLPRTPPATVARLLDGAWAADPATALRLVANLRGVRGSGKSDREGFYAAALWLHARHPATLACNAASVAAFGYLKDLPELLHRIVRGGVSNRAARRMALLADGGRRGVIGLARYRDSLGRRRRPRHARRHGGGAPRCQTGARPEARGRGRGVAPEQEGGCRRVFWNLAYSKAVPVMSDQNGVALVSGFSKNCSSTAAASSPRGPSWRRPSSGRSTTSSPCSIETKDRIKRWQHSLHLCVSHCIVAGDSC